MRIPIRLSLASLLTLAVLLSAFAFGATPAFADTECASCKPWWHVTSGSRPANLQPEEKGQIVVTAANLGDTDVDGSKTPVRIVDSLPAGLEAVSVEGEAGGPGTRNRGPVKCSLKPLACTFEGTLPPYDLIEVRIGVLVKEDASSGDLNEASVSGGETPSASVRRPIKVSGVPTPFGVEDYELVNEEEGGVPDTQAGSHPFQQTTTLTLNQTAEAQPAALAKDLHLQWPAGLIGNTTPFPRCTLATFLSINNRFEDLCSPQTAVGVAMISIAKAGVADMETFATPVFDLEPAVGEPARFGFVAPFTPVVIDISVRNGGDYGVTVSANNIPQIVGFLSSQVTVWGVPGDPRHDSARGWGCLAAARESKPTSPCPPLAESNPPAFLIMPTSCTGPLQTSVEADSWAAPGRFETFLPPEPLQALDGCNQLSFSPTIQAEPTTDRASAPSGLDVNLNFNDEGLTSAEGLAQSQLKNTVVTLPEGFTINPSAGVGLGGCTPADYTHETLTSSPGAGCPNDSKLGTVEIETPLLTQKIHGSLFIAEPHENPFGSLVAIYVVAKNPETGILIKLAGKVTPNPVTGQLVTTFENNPQLAFDHFNFHFREGQQAPLISPPACGTYTIQAGLTPWSEPATVLTDTSSFTITKGFDGGECPSGGGAGGIPFHPQIQSGTLNNNAGAFSPFYLHLTRTDAEQEISGFSTDLPEGLTGDLSGIPFCPEAGIALARTKTGAQEEAEPSCPTASQVGHTLVGTGVGAVLAYVPGKIYLAGPYNGDPFSLVSVTSAKVGPFDLGTVVLRFALKIDPYTAKVSVDPTASEPIPTIIDGIVTHVRDIRVYIDKQNFTLNPTSCNPMSISSTLTSNLGQSATIISPFQAASCKNLQFAPKFVVSTQAKTSKANGASLHVKLTYPTGALGNQANIARVKVDLPKQLPSRLTTLQKACTAAQFNTNPAGCPSASIIGHAKAITPLIPVPLEGPAYFVSHGGEAFPSLIMVLQGYGVTIDLVGTTFISKAGITSSTFKTVPDQPVGNFELTLPEGKYSALTALGDLCKTKLAMPTAFLAQNGLEIHQSTKISTTGCPKHKTKHTKNTTKHKKAQQHNNKKQ